MLMQRPSATIMTRSRKTDGTSSGHVRCWAWDHGNHATPERHHSVAVSLATGLSHVAETSCRRDVLGDSGVTEVLDLSRPTDMRLQTLGNVHRHLTGS